MAGKVKNIKACSPLKLHHSLTGKCHAICHYSYNLPLAVIPHITKTRLISLANVNIFRVFYKKLE